MAKVTCPRCGWSKVTKSKPQHVLAGHNGECPKREAAPKKRDRVKWKDWRTVETPFTPMTPAEIHRLKLQQRGVTPPE